MRPHPLKLFLDVQPPAYDSQSLSFFCAMNRLALCLVQLLEALLSESGERRADLEARQAARAAQLLARQEQMAAAAQARREERLQLMGHLAPVPKPVTHKEELEQLRKYGHTNSCNCLSPSVSLACKA